MIGKSPLPYLDTKPKGAPDFYFGINATFRFIRRRFGIEGLIRYWTDIGRDYMRPVSQLWKREGVAGIAHYWRAFFDAEPGAEVDVEKDAEKVVLRVHTCPLISHLRKHGREIEPLLCQHCYYVSQAAAKSSGFEVRVIGGNGKCEQHFFPADKNAGSQDIDSIALC